MINAISKTLGAQEKTQDIKQSPSTKIGTKPDVRSRRNELIEGTGRCIGRSDAQDAAQDAPIKQQQSQQQRPDAAQDAGPDARQLTEVIGRWTRCWVRESDQHQ